MRISDWSSDVCSSDLAQPLGGDAVMPGDECAQLGGERRVPPHQVEIVARRAAIGLAAQPVERNEIEIVVRSEERRVGKECVSRVDLGGRRIIKKKKTTEE